jgi:hypothetical protein
VFTPGAIATLAGNVRVGGGGLMPGVPEPGNWALMIGAEFAG